MLPDRMPPASLPTHKSMTSSFPYRCRRTIKPAQMDSSRAIPRELLLELLEDANWAPTHGLTQPWRFHVFTGGGRDRLADMLQYLFEPLRPKTRSGRRSGQSYAMGCFWRQVHRGHGADRGRRKRLRSWTSFAQRLRCSKHTAFRASARSGIILVNAARGL